MTRRILYWLSQPVALYFSRDYRDPLARHGLEWTLGLIDEDIERYGNAYVHHLAKAGVILRSSSNGSLSDAI